MACPIGVERHLTRQRGFTVVELLVVVSIIAILGGLLLPVLRNAKSTAKRATCLNNLRQINMGLRIYADECGDVLSGIPWNRTNYSSLLKHQVGLTQGSSPQDKLFACPADTFYYGGTNKSIMLINRGLHEEAFSDFSSYGFNAGNLKTNLARFGVDYTKLGVAGRKMSSIKNPSRTVLVHEGAAESPWSWHQPRLPLALKEGEQGEFENSMNVLSFVDGHASYVRMYWSHSTTNGLALNAGIENPPPEYAYQWSGD